MSLTSKSVPVFAGRFLRALRLAMCHSLVYCRILVLLTFVTKHFCSAANCTSSVSFGFLLLRYCCLSGGFHRSDTPIKPTANAPLKQKALLCCVVQKEEKTLCLVLVDLCCGLGGLPSLGLCRPCLCRRLCPSRAEGPVWRRWVWGGSCLLCSSTWPQQLPGLHPVGAWWCRCWEPRC